MSNPLFKKETYPFMNEDTKIGTFTVDCDADGEYVYTIDLNENTPNELIPWDFTDIDDVFVSKERNFNWHTELVELWVKSRVFPPERDNAEKLLRLIGISEYDELEVLKYTYGRDHIDPYWINFDEGEETDENGSE